MSQTQYASLLANLSGFLRPSTLSAIIADIEDSLEDAPRSEAKEEFLGYCEHALTELVGRDTAECLVARAKKEL